MHYEADQYPDEVPITKYDEFDFGEHQPDMIFIHNPYDSANLVTSVHPFFYSDNLKKFTNCLIYIPYYATAGGMSEGQALCPAYINADYIVIQSEKYRKFFDRRIPDSKFLAFGSPKFDSVLHKCQNPPAAVGTWKEKAAGKKVYFYNTSIGGMLENTDAFLKKMKYVFDIFKKREDACLLWRPHPLMESTLDSMRKGYKSRYLALKKKFIEEDIGIFDETADIENTITLCDAYIGDSATSVTSLFGIAGKPLFILNNYINTLPKTDDWRGEVIHPIWDIWGDDRYWVTSNNQLWFSENNDYHYKFYMDLETGYSGGGYYLKAAEIKGKIYVFPQNARNLLVIENKKIKKVDFRFDIMQNGAFCSYWYNEKYIFLIPFRYPALVRFDIETEEVQYIDEIRKFNVRNINGEWCVGGICAYGNDLVFASPKESSFLFMDMDTMKTRALESNAKSNLGVQGIVPNGDELWLLPINGMLLTQWNPKTGEVREYGDLPRNFKSVRWPYELECEERPFGNIVFSRKDGKEQLIISPTWGNMFLSLDRESGILEEWKPPVSLANCGNNGYFSAIVAGGFVGFASGEKSRLWCEPARKLYEVNIDTGEYKEIRIVFDCVELREHILGFAEESEWMQYCLCESAFNSLKDFLDDNITGSRFDIERQVRAYEKVNANSDGTCGKNVYDFAKGKIL